MDKPQRLGMKTFWIFLLTNSGPALVSLLVFGISLKARAYLTSDIEFTVVGYITLISAAMFFIFAFFDLAVSWLTYANYTYTLSDDAFKVNRGILNKEETAIPYRQIQSVDMRQDAIGLMFGYSRLVILTAGHDEADMQGEAEADFPPIDKGLAKSLQAELIKRSETQRVVVVQNQNK